MDTDRQSAGQEDQTREASQYWLFDAFYEPRTIPAHWDLTEITGSLKTLGNNRASHAAAYPELDPADQAENVDSGAALHIFYLDPFSEPRTFPARWDLSW